VLKILACLGRIFDWHVTYINNSQYVKMVTLCIFLLWVKGSLKVIFSGWGGDFFPSPTMYILWVLFLLIWNFFMHIYPLDVIFHDLSFTLLLSFKYVFCHFMGMLMFYYRIVYELPTS
jgi:hypothetical protein